MMMKLVFPAGDRPQMLLDRGTYRIGSAADADVALAVDGIEALHCELQVGAHRAHARGLPRLVDNAGKKPRHRSYGPDHGLDRSQYGC